MRYNYRSSKSIFILIAINLFVFIIIKIAPTIYPYLALYNPIGYLDFYWTIVTAMFVHLSFSHIFVNMLVLFFFGILCLQLIGTTWFLVIYFIGGIFGNILFLLIGPESFLIGASGAVYAIMGVLAVMRPKQRVYLYFVIPMPLFVVVLLGMVISYFAAGVAWEAHFGGLIVGLIAGFFFRWKERKPLRPGYYSVRW